MKDIESVKTEKFKFEVDKFLELILDEPKMPNYVTAARRNSILDQQSHLRAQGICQGLSHWAGLDASKPPQVSKYRYLTILCYYIRSFDEKGWSLLLIIETLLKSWSLKRYWNLDHWNVIEILIIETLLKSWSLKGYWNLDH